MSNYQVAITTAGLSAARNASVGGYKISVTKIKIGDAIIDASTADVRTDIAGNKVYETSNLDGILFYQLVGDDSMQFRIYLNDLIGNFAIGNVGLFLEDGTLFALACMPYQYHKIARTTTESGNAFKIYITTRLSNMATVYNLNIQQQDVACIPQVQEESLLPNYGTAPFNLYDVFNYAGTGQGALALRGSDRWIYFQGTSNIITNCTFTPEATLGKLVYYNSANSIWDLADGTNLSKLATGVRIEGNNVQTKGYYTSAGAFDAGYKYYASSSGTFTTTVTQSYVGEAVDSNTILLGLDTRVNASYNERGVLMFGSENEVRTGTDETKGVNLKDLSTVYAQKGRNETITGSWSFSQLISGTSYRAWWGDLAEYYHMDAEYPVGTLVKFGGNADMTIAVDHANAVITSNPGFILNGSDKEESENMQAIALIGRVPVRVTGKVNKHDYICMSNSPGIAIAMSGMENREILGRALESNDSEDEKLVLCSMLLSME